MKHDLMSAEMCVPCESKCENVSSLWVPREQAGKSRGSHMSLLSPFPQKSRNYEHIFQNGFSMPRDFIVLPPDL